ncbi:hypothetical protein C8J25_10336 [Sphingomonas faeni]|uniref:DUF4136 domain-containing protein n=1 Tax=Sphingomonas faeni TaxID=185950 RepID=A0A2T5U765_9SPHN|nr:hypothetical protein C8J25_10336 [Sphingomonas faeni]
MYLLLSTLAATLMQSPVAASVVKPGTIAIVAADSPTTSPAVTKTFTDAVQRTLLRTPFLPLPDANHSLYVAKVEVSQTQRGVVRSGNDRSDRPGVAAGFGGLSLTLPSGKDQLHGLIVTRLKVTVSLRRDSHVVWTGQATTVRASGTRTGDPSVVAAALSDALLTWFPRQLPGPLSVP